MSEAVPPQNQPGPRERQILFLWERAWAEHAKGASYAFFISQASAEIEDWKANLQPDDAASRLDLLNAQRLNRSHAETFSTEERKLEIFRSQISAARDQLVQQGLKVGFFAFQYLALANGAVALGTLGYIGKDGSGPTSLVLTWGGWGQGRIMFNRA